MLRGSIYIVANTLITIKKFVNCFVFVLTPLVAIVTCHRLYKLPDPILLLPFKVCPQDSLRSTNATQTWGRLAGRFWFCRSPTWFQVRGRICLWQILAGFEVLTNDIKSLKTNKQTKTAEVPKNCSAPPEYPHTSLVKKYSSRKSFDAGEKVFYNCAEDFTPSKGLRVVQCSDGTWTKLTLKCESE